MSTSTDSERKFEPPFGPIFGSILGIVGWLVFIILYALVWSQNYDFFQNAMVAVASLLITGLAIGAVWIAWFRLTDAPRSWWDSEQSGMVRERVRRAGKKNNKNEILTLGQRSGEFVAVVVTLLILGFYLYHQVANTGFFTSGFGGWEMFAFYGSIIISLAPPIARAIIGRRNPARPIEAASNIFFALASLWLLLVFPFNFAHFADALPVGMRFLLDWVSNDLARVAFVLAFIGSLASGIYNIVRYVTFTEAYVGQREEDSKVRIGETAP